MGASLTNDTKQNQETSKMVKKMKKNPLKILFGLSFFIVIGKILGFIKVSMIASTYGAGFITDVYAFEDGLANELSSLLASFIACSFIPKFLSLKNQQKQKLFNVILNFGLLFTIIICVMCAVCTKSILWILVPGYFNLYDIEQISFYTRINVVMLTLTFLVNYLIVVLQSYKFFIYITLEGILSNAGILLYLWLFNDFGLLGLIVCRILIYLTLAIIVLSGLIRKTPLRVIIPYTIWNKDFSDMLKVWLPILCLNMLWQVNYIVDRSMASWFDSGSLACLNYANILAMSIYAVIGYVISTYVYPLIGDEQNSQKNLSLIFIEYFRILLLLILPISIICMSFPDTFVNIVYEHGKMITVHLKIVSALFVLYIPGVIAYCTKNYYSKLYYVKRKTKTLLCVEICGCLLNIILNIILSQIYGVYGLAAATSISFISTAILMIIISHYKLHIGFNINLIISSLKLVIFVVLYCKLIQMILAHFRINNFYEPIFILTASVLICGKIWYKSLIRITQR